MSTQHKIVAEYPLAGSDDGLPVEITYTYTRGRPAVMYLRNGDPGYPADPEEVEFASASLTGIFAPVWILPPIMKKAIDAWSREWLESDEGYSAACAKAFDDLQPDPDYAREDAADRRERE